jgi:hypothetical protein
MESGSFGFLVLVFVGILLISAFLKPGKELFVDLTPAPDTLDSPREPYHLLNGVLPNAPRDSIGCLTSGCCHATDFEQRTDLTGNFIQRTNNYKRGYPDTCSAPLEFVTAFYKTKPLQDY